MDTGETVFKSNETDQQMTLQDAEDMIRKCGPLSNMLWPYPLEQRELNMCSARCSCCSLNVENILIFVPEDRFFRIYWQYCKDVFATNTDDGLHIFKLEWNSPAPFTWWT